MVCRKASAPSLTNMTGSRTCWNKRNGRRHKSIRSELAAGSTSRWNPVARLTEPPGLSSRVGELVVSPQADFCSGITSATFGDSLSTAAGVSAIPPVSSLEKLWISISNISNDDLFSWSSSISFACFMFNSSLALAYVSCKLLVSFACLLTRAS